MTTSLIYPSEIIRSRGFNVNKSYALESYGLQIEELACKEDTFIYSDEAHYMLLLNIGSSLTFKYQLNCSNFDKLVEPGSFVVVTSGIESVIIPGGNRLIKVLLAKDDRKLFSDLHILALQTCWNVKDSFMSLLVEQLYYETVDLSGSRLVVKSLVSALMIHLQSCYSENQKVVFAPKGKLSAKQLYSVVSFARTSIQRNVRLAELASCVHLSEYHFARLFRQTTGMSPYHFVLTLKIEYAKNLIKTGAKSFGDIAYLLSFADQAHFSHAFKKITGVSPRQFVSTI